MVLNIRNAYLIEEVLLFLGQIVVLQRALRQAIVRARCPADANRIEVVRRRRARLGQRDVQAIAGKHDALVRDAF